MRRRLVSSSSPASPRARPRARRRAGPRRSALARLFADWREAQRPRGRGRRPRLHAGRARAPAPRRSTALRARLAAIDPAGLRPPARIDRRAGRGRDERARLRPARAAPWSRNPAFYANAIAEQSDTPAHEGRTIEGAIELWQLSLAAAGGRAARALQAAAAAIPRLLVQARANLTGDARDLWSAGSRSEREQAETLRALRRARCGRTTRSWCRTSSARAPPSSSSRAGSSASCLRKHGRSGVGRENYDWYLKNVYLVPYTWQDELRLMERELDRSLAHLALEEHRNRALPPLEPAASAERVAARARTSALAYYVRFLREQEMLSLRDYYEPALRARLGAFAPARQARVLLGGRRARAAAAALPRQPLARPRADGARAARERRPARSAALQHLGAPRRGRRDRDGGARDERRALRRAAAQPRARLRDDRAARRARDLGAAHALERVDARRGGARGLRAHAARLAAARRRARLERAAALPRAARLRLELPGGQGPVRGARWPSARARRAPAFTAARRSWTS